MKETKEVKQEESSVENKVLKVGAGMLVAGLVIGFLFGFFWHKGTDDSVLDDSLNSMATTSDTTASTTSTLSTTAAPVPTMLYQTVSAQASVSVVDQPAGNLVFIQHADVSVPTWVAVREIIDGAVGNILGAEMVTGATDDLPVTLLRSTKKGEQSGVFLYQEDGDGQFDFKKDALVMQENTPVSAVFTAE